MMNATSQKFMIVKKNVGSPVEMNVAPPLQQFGLQSKAPPQDLTSRAKSQHESKGYKSDVKSATQASRTAW